MEVGCREGVGAHRHRVELEPVRCGFAIGKETRFVNLPDTLIAKGRAVGIPGLVKFRAGPIPAHHPMWGLTNPALEAMKNQHFSFTLEAAYVQRAVKGSSKSGGGCSNGSIYDCHVIGQDSDIRWSTE